MKLEDEDGDLEHSRGGIYATQNAHVSGACSKFRHPTSGCLIKRFLTEPRPVRVLPATQKAEA